MIRPLLARAGEVIRDKDGAVFATVARDLHRGQTMHPNDLTFADGHVPVFGESLPESVLNFLYGVSGCRMTGAFDAHR